MFKTCYFLAYIKKHIFNKFFFVEILFFLILFGAPLKQVHAQVNHPRIWLDNTTITRIRAQIASTHYGGTASADSSQFTAFMASADSYAAMPVAPYDRNAAPSNVINYAYEGAGWLAAAQTLGLAYQITGNTTYSDKVKEILDSMVNTGLVLSLTDITGITPGMSVSGTNIPAGTTVVSVNASGNNYDTWPQITLSNWITDTIAAGTVITIGGTDYSTPTTSTSYSNLGNQDPQRVDTGYPSRNSALALALAYDWIYDQLNSTDKTNLAHVLDTWWAQLNLNGYRWSSGMADNGCGNYAVGHLLGFSTLAIAFEGDSTTTADIFSNSSHGVLTRLNSIVIPQISSGCYASGYTSESYSYGGTNIIRLAQTIKAYQSAGKADLIGDFDLNGWLRKVNIATIYNERPDNWGISDEGDWAGQFSGIFGSNLPYVAAGLMGNSVAESAYGLWQVANANYTAIPGGTPGPSYGYTVTPFNAFFYYDPTITAADYTATLPTYWYGNAPGDYHSFIRTDWTTSAIQTSFTGWNGHSTDHQSYAAGHVYVQRGADRLLINAGQWNGTIGVQGTPSQFSQANWTLNTLYVYDSATVPSGAGSGYPYCASYGCQSGSLSPIGPVAHKETADYVYSKANLTSTYGNNSRGGTPIKTYYRSFVNIAGISFVYDYSVATDYVNAVRKQFWHTPALTSNSPAGIATDIAITGGIASATVGSSTIWIKPLLPTSAAITVANDQKAFTGVQTGTQRFEISDPDQATVATTSYLTVLAPTASFVGAMPTTTNITASGFVGAFYDDGSPKAVLLSKDGTSQSTFVYSISAVGAVRHVIADLVPATYMIYQNGTLIATQTAGDDGTISFTSTGGGTFSSYVLVDVTAPTVTDFTIPATSSSTTVTINTFTATDDIAIAGYLLTESSSTPATTTLGWTLSSPTSYTFSSAGIKTLYAWAEDAAGNVSTSLNDSVIITLPTPTYTIGGAIDGLSDTVVLQNNLTDNISTTTNGSFTFVTATTTGGAYNITVLTQPLGQTCTVTNGSGTVASSNITNVTITCTDVSAPTSPSNLTATAVSSAQINLSWTAATDAGGSGLAGYQIFRCLGSACAATVQIATSTANSYSDTGLAALTNYSYRLKAYDGNLNISDYSASVTVTTTAVPDTTPPVISAIASTTAISTATITWTTDEAATGQVEYGLSSSYSASSTLITATTTSHSIFLSGLSPLTAYHFRILSKDTSNNLVASADCIFQTTVAPDTTAPAVTLTSPLAGAYVYGSSVTLTATSTDNIGVVGVRFYYDTTHLIGSEITATSAPNTYTATWNTTSGVVDGSRTLIAVSRDAAGNITTSSALSVIVDNIAPVITAVASTTAASTAAITWATSGQQSNSQVEYGLTSGYGFSTILDSTLVTTHSVSLTGLSGSTTYHFRVKSIDAAGNLGLSTDQTFLTTATPDTTAPTNPSGLVASTTSATGIDLSWTNSADSVGVAGYKIFRCQNISCTPEVQIATSTISSYSDSNLAINTTYNYAISAFDGADNVSGKSDSASATTFNLSLDIASPTIPDNFSATAVSSSEIDLFWSTSTDPIIDGQINSGLAGYHIYRSGSVIATTTQISYQDTGLSALTSYSYTVSAFDVADNKSDQATSTSATTQAATVSSGGGGGGGGGSYFSISFSSINVSSTTTTEALVTWLTTGYSVDSAIDYGTSTAYSQTVTNSVATTTHSIWLTNLLPGITYHFRVRTSSGVASGDYSFISGTGSTALSSNSQTNFSTNLSFTGSTSNPSSNIRLVNASGTFYLIINGQRHGITNPGMLATYGLIFSQGEKATADDLTLPEGNTLWPNNGSLVKSKEDSTVYLISQNQRFGFTSQKIFSSLGFKLSSVLVVTNPELQILPKAGNLDKTTGAHLQGTDINKNGTIYWIGGDNALHAYPSLAVYNSWHKKNDFSKVVPANSDDIGLPLSTDVSERVLQSESDNAGLQTAHLPGTDINKNGTIYWIGGDNALHAYPSLAVYNSWHKKNDFSKVVNANSADLNLPIGDLVELKH